MSKADKANKTWAGCIEILNIVRSWGYELEPNAVQIEEDESGKVGKIRIKERDANKKTLSK